MPRVVKGIHAQSNWLYAMSKLLNVRIDMICNMYDIYIYDFGKLFYNLILEVAKLDVVIHLNSSWPSDTMWGHRSVSTIVQVINCCLMAPSNYLNQCWFIIRYVLWLREISQVLFMNSIHNLGSEITLMISFTHIQGPMSYYVIR